MLLICTLDYEYNISILITASYLYLVQYIITIIAVIANLVLYIFITLLEDVCVNLHISMLHT